MSEEQSIWSPSVLENAYNRPPASRLDLVRNLLTQQHLPADPLEGLLSMANIGPNHEATIREGLALQSAIAWNRIQDIPKNLFEIAYVLGIDSLERGQGTGINLDGILAEAKDIRIPQTAAAPIVSSADKILRYLQELDPGKIMQDQARLRDVIGIIRAKNFLIKTFGEEDDKWPALRDRLSSEITGNTPFERTLSAARVIGGRVLQTYPNGYSATSARSMTEAFAAGKTPNCQEAVKFLEEVLPGGHAIYYFIDFNGKLAPHVFYRHGDLIIPYADESAIERKHWARLLQFTFESYKEGQPVMERSTLDALGLADEIAQSGCRIVEI